MAVGNSKIEVSFDMKAIRVMERMAKALEKANKAALVELAPMVEYDMVLSLDGLVIDYNGQEYFKPCGLPVRIGKLVKSYCVKPMAHKSNVCEDMMGHTALNNDETMIDTDKVIMEQINDENR